MNAKVLLLLAMVAVAAADRRPAYSYGAPQTADDSEEFEDPKYGFNWAVEDDDTGNDFAQQEARDDDDTRGSYYVQLPDGRLQTVTYYVDGDSGYVAEVKYEGEARYPDSKESRESYAPPRPSYGYGK